jgi:hypothetical protein
MANLVMAIGGYWWIFLDIILVAIAEYFML